MLPMIKKKKKKKFFDGFLLPAEEGPNFSTLQSGHITM